MKNPDNASGYTQIGDDQTSTTYTDVISVHLVDWINASYKVQSCNQQGCTDSVAVYLVQENSANAVGYLKASNPRLADYFGSSVALSADGSTLAVGAYGVDSDAPEVIENPIVDQISAKLRDRSGAVYVFERVDHSWQQTAYLKPETEDTSLYFGASISISDDGNTLAIGAYGEDSNATGIDGDQDNSLAGGSGAAYIYTHNGNIWTQSAYIKASDTASGDWFGTSVELSGDGNILAVGAPGHSVEIEGITVSFSGAVYVFSNTTTTWIQQAYIVPTDINAAGYFGSSVALDEDGDVLAIYSSGPDAIYLLQRSGDDWSDWAELDSDGIFTGALSLSDDGTVLAVGAVNDSSGATGIDGDSTDTSASKSGAVYVFATDGSDWMQQAYIKASNAEKNDRFGVSLSLSSDGTFLAVGASAESSVATGVNGDQYDNSESSCGAVYMFARQNDAWTQTSYIKPSNSSSGVEYFGGSIALSSDAGTLAVGATGEDSFSMSGNQQDTSGGDAGAVYVY